MVGTIYLARIYFTDMSAYKIRPVIVIKHFGEDCMCLPLTSKSEHHGIEVTNRDVTQGSLKKDSLVIFPKSFTLHNSILIKQVATVSSEKYSDIFSMYCHQLGCHEIL